MIEHCSVGATLRKNRNLHPALPSPTILYEWPDTDGNLVRCRKKSLRTQHKSAQISATKSDISNEKAKQQRHVVAHLITWYARRVAAILCSARTFDFLLPALAIALREREREREREIERERERERQSRR